MHRGQQGSPVKHAQREILQEPFAEYEAAHLPIQTVGVQGDFRTYREVLAVRGPLDYERLNDLSSTCCNSDSRFNRVIAFLAGVIGRFQKASSSTVNFWIPSELSVLREADNVVKETMHREGITDSVWQFPTILAPISYEGGELIVLRPVNSEDGMTAAFGRVPPLIINEIAKRISQIDGVDMVFLDVTDKPPATIEWE